MRNVTLTLILSTLFLSLPALAQKCTEQFVKNSIEKQDAQSDAEDLYFFSGALEKPIVGSKAPEWKKVDEKLTQERKNEKRDAPKPDLIVVAPSGDMAYSYGTAHMSFDEASTGKHVDFTAAYLTVWKIVNGSCKVAATMFQPEGDR
jgi:hypothetical protein